MVPLKYDWSMYSTVVLPSVLLLSASDTQRLADFVASGGRVVIGYATGLLDEHFHTWLGGYPGAGNGLLRKMLGVRGEEFNILGREAEGEPFEIELGGGMEGAVTRLWQNDVNVEGPDTEVLATYSGKAADEWELDGSAAITRNPYGSGARVTQELIDSGVPFDGIVAFNDQLALGALFTLAANNIGVPDQVQVIGFDNIEEAAYFQPPLTTMDSCLDWIAPTAFNRIVDRIGGRHLEPERITTQSRVIARATTRAIPCDTAHATANA